MKLYDDTVLKDAIDIHIHVGPDYMPRYADALTLAEEAWAAGMRGIVIKCHLTSTVGAAHAAMQAVPEVAVFGSISLNETVGGLSPRSVQAAVRSGAKVVWLPTTDAQYAMDKAKEGHWIRHYVNGSNFGYDCNRLTVTDQSGALKPEVKEIVQICQDNRTVLCSGHISPGECLAVAKYAKEIGFDKVEITHANTWVEDFTNDVLKEPVSYGAVVSLSYGACSPPQRPAGSGGDTGHYPGHWGGKLHYDDRLRPGDQPCPGQRAAGLLLPDEETGLHRRGAGFDDPEKPGKTP